MLTKDQVKEAPENPQGHDELSWRLNAVRVDSGLFNLFELAQLETSGWMQRRIKTFVDD